MNSNALSLLTLQNPFYLNHTQLHLLGVHIIITPTLLSFAQVQNFMLWEAIERNWRYYFWGHMDILALSREETYDAQKPEEYKSLYMEAVEGMRNITSPNPNGDEKKWAIMFFNYDFLSLVNREAYEETGGYDTQIPYYASDCDFYDRAGMRGWERLWWRGETWQRWGSEGGGGMGVFDVADTLDDLIVLYRKMGVGIKEAKCAVVEEEEREDAVLKAQELQEEVEKRENDGRLKADAQNAWNKQVGEWTHEWIDDAPNSTTYQHLRALAKKMAWRKSYGRSTRNTWQDRQRGGKGEPYYRKPEGFETGLQMTIDFGRTVYRRKWGSDDCSLLGIGRKTDDEWKGDWEEKGVDERKARRKRGLLEEWFWRRKVDE